MDLHSGHWTEEIWWASVVVLIAPFVATIAARLFDKRLLDGASVWGKPLKFQASLALHFATLALIVGALGEVNRSGTLLWWVAVASVAATAFEISYIMIQAGRGAPSHLNLSTPFYAAMYTLMAVGAVIITLAAGVVGVVALADIEAHFGPALRIGVGGGLIGGTMLTLLTAFRMGGALNHHVGSEPAGAPRVPLTGWSLAVGDRRVPHFFATHMMQVVPIAALIAEPLFSARIACVSVLVFAGLWAVATLGLFRQANMGLPLQRWRA